MFSELLLPMTGTSTDGPALDAGVLLARALEAHLAVLETVNLPMFMRFMSSAALNCIKKTTPLMKRQKDEHPEDAFWRSTDDGAGRVCRSPSNGRH